MSRKPARPDISDEDLSGEEVRLMLRQRARKRFIAISLPVLALLALILVLGIPAANNWRARQFAKRADELRMQGKLQEAFNNASSAMQMRPGIPEVERSYARVLLAGGEAAGLQVMQQLVDSGNASAEDRLELAEASLRLGDVPRAENGAFQLLQQGQNTPQALHVLARVRLAQQRVPDALQALQESIEAGGGTDSAILLARLRLAANTPESIKSAIGLLSPIARQNDQAGLEALLLLINSTTLDTDEAPGWIEALKNHPLANSAQKLSAASAEMRRHPGDHAQIIEETIQANLHGSLEDRVELARWLNQNREYQGVLDIIPRIEATAHGDLFLIRLDALAGLGKWEEIAGILRNGSPPLNEAVILLYRGRAARELGSPEEAASFYRRAMSEATQDPGIMQYVIKYLQGTGEDRILEQELLRLADNPTDARQAFAALVPLIQKRRSAEALYTLYEHMLNKLPSDPVVQNDHRYFSALTGRRADVSGGRELVSKEPRMLAYRITLALVHLKSGQNEAALRVFDGITLNPKQILPYQRAVLAAVLGANGREEEARELAAGVPDDVVTVEETKLIAPWRKKN